MAVAEYVQQEYRPTPAEIDRLREVLRQDDQSKLQIGVQGWYLREDPTTGQDKGGFRYPNRSTPRTVAILLSWAEGTASLAAEEIAKFDAAGLPFVPIGDVGQPELRGDLADFRDELKIWKAENARGIQDFPDLEGGDLRWREQVFGPLFFGIYPDGRDTYPQFLRARIIGRAAGVGAQSLDEASDLFWEDIKSGLEVATIGAGSIMLATAIGIAAAVLVTRKRERARMLAP